METHPEERYYKLNRFLLWVSGLWPYQSKWSARLMRIVNFTVYLVTAFIQILSVLTSEITMEFITSILSLLLPTLGILSQFYIRIKLINKLRKLLEQMWDDWALQKTYDEIKIMHEHAEIARSWTFYYLSFTYLGVTTYNIWLHMPEILDIISPVNESRPRIQLPYIRLDFFIDEEKYFYFIRFLEIIMMFVSPLASLACSTLFVAFTQHACAMCQLLGFTSVMDSYYTIPCIVDLVGCVLVTSMTVSQILIVGKTEETLRYIVFTTILLCYMFIFNYMGEKVTTESSNICNKVYNSAWYNAVVSEQKLLLLIIRRHFQPLVLTAWFYVFSLPNFRSVLQTVISYCMFIKQI